MVSALDYGESDPDSIPGTGNCGTGKFIGETKQIAGK